MFQKNKTVQTLWLGALLLAPIVLWFMPSTAFDDSDIIVCPSRLFFDIECLGCGMTRAVQHMHHFEWEDAAYYNAGVMLIYPALIVVWAIWVYRTWRRVKFLNAQKL